MKKRSERAPLSQRIMTCNNAIVQHLTASGAARMRPKRPSPKQTC